MDARFIGKDVGCFTVGSKYVKINAKHLLCQLTLRRHLAFDTEKLAVGWR